MPEWANTKIVFYITIINAYAFNDSIFLILSTPHSSLFPYAKGSAPVKKTAHIKELLREATGFALRGANIKPEFSIPEALWAVDVDTTFCIYLPASSNTIAEKNDVAEGKPITGNGKILIMDDDEFVRDMGRRTLSFIGYEVVYAVSGAEVIEMRKNARESGKPFDVVIMGRWGGRRGGH